MAKSKSQKKQSKQQGGDGAADHAIRVYGDTNSQHAVSSTDNTIAMNNGIVPSMKGGKRQNEGTDEPQVVGDNAPKEPSLLERLNPFSTSEQSVSGGKQTKQQLQKQIMKQLKQLKQQGGGLSPLCFSEYSSSPQSVAEPQPTPEATARVAINASANQSGGSDGKQLDLQKGFLKAGSKLSKQQLQSLNQQLDKLQKQQGGVGLNEIVVPLVLLYASQKYAQGKTTKKNMKKLRKSMRKSIRFSK